MIVKRTPISYVENLEDLNKLDYHASQKEEAECLHLHTHVYLPWRHCMLGKNGKNQLSSSQFSHTCDNRDAWKPPLSCSEVIPELQTHCTNHGCPLSYLCTIYCT